MVRVFAILAILLLVGCVPVQPRPAVVALADAPQAVPVACQGTQTGSVLAIQCDLAQESTPQPTASVAPLPAPTDTPTPATLPTPTPTLDLLPSATPTPLARENWPLCPTHDATQWHALDDPVRQCHYDHFHGDDPNSPLALKWFQPITDSISYPWQTFKVQADGSILKENELKHSGYLWLVRQLVRQDENGKWYEINNDLNWVGRTPNVVMAVRMEIHRHPTMDSKVQKHSYWMETFECGVVNGAINWDACGISSSGGVAHFGVLHCAYKAIYCQLSTDESVPANQWLPGQDTSGKIIDPYRATNKPCRMADQTGVLDRLDKFPDGWSLSGTTFDDNNRDNWSLWTTGPGVYGADKTGKGYNWLAGGALISTDDPDCNDLDAYRSAQSLSDATAIVNARICDHAPAGTLCRFDGSEHAIFTAYSYTPAEWDGKAGIDTDGSKNGFVTMRGYTDLRGNLSPGCTETGATCVPIVKIHSPVGWAGWNTAVGTWKNGKAPGNLLDYNTSPSGEQWISIGETGMSH